LTNKTTFRCDKQTRSIGIFPLPGNHAFINRTKRKLAAHMLIYHIASFASSNVIEGQFLNDIYCKTKRS
jgi:hypothetical protein